MILGTTKDEGIIWLIAPLANLTLFEEHQENWDSKLDREYDPANISIENVLSNVQLIY